MASYSSSQKQVIDTIFAVARQRHIPLAGEVVKSALETGAVESNFQNLPGGDADSAGWRQERASLYKNPTNLRASVGRYLDEAQGMAGKYGRAGDLAAAVQRPAAQYRGRYQQHAGQAESLLQQFAGGAPVSGPAKPGGGKPTALSPTNTTTTQTTTPVVDQAALAQAQKKSVLANYLQQRNPNNVLLKTGAVSTAAPNPQDFTTEQTTSHTTTSGGSELGTPGSLADAVPAGTLAHKLGGIVERATTLDRRNLPYVYGGGHTSGKINVHNTGPVDCSAAVSAVLGVNTRVSGDFEKWGAPGAAKSPHGVTVYANGGHTFLKIGNRFFGTSGFGHPGKGTGAAWFTVKPGSDYLKGFTARHLPGT